MDSIVVAAGKLSVRAYTDTEQGGAANPYPRKTRVGAADLDVRRNKAIERLYAQREVGTLES